MTEEDRRCLKGGHTIERHRVTSHRYSSEPYEFAEWIPVWAVESWFGFSKSSTYRLLAQDLIEGRKLGSRTLINVASIRRYLACQPRPMVKVDAASAKLTARPVHRASAVLERSSKVKRRRSAAAEENATAV